MDSPLLGVGAEQVLEAVLDAGPAELLLVNPPADVFESFVEAVVDRDRRPEARVLAEKRVLKDTTEDFVLASRTADLVESDDLTLRSADLPRTSLLVTPDRVVSLVAVGDRVGGLATDDEAFLGDVRDAYEFAWTDATPFTLRTPAITRVRESLAESIGPDAEADFEAMLDSVETARGGEGELDEVVISLLVAAKNEVLLYDVSKWGEDIGIASKATFSRTKTRLEELGLIGTEKVPIDVGRPRLRLTLADDRLRGADAAELTSVTQSVLAS
jgi:hypothetical protein